MTTFEKINIISELIPKILNFDEPKRIRRGILHGGICKALKIPLSNRNVRFIKMVLEAYGVREVIIHGKPFYSTQMPTIHSPHYKKDLSPAENCR